MKEEDYFMMLMSTYGENEQMYTNEFRKIDVVGISFKCLETVHNHYQSRGAVESHSTRH